MLLTFKHVLAFVFLVLIGQVTKCESARILILGLVGSKSHKMSLMPIAKALASRGHEITFVTSYPADDKQIVSNIKDIHILNPAASDGEFNWFQIASVNPFILYPFFFKMVAEKIESGYNLMMNNVEFQAVLKSRDVDLAILDDSFNEFFLPIIDDLGVPFVYYSPSTGYPWVFSSMGMPLELSSIPIRFSGYNNEMTFKERLINTIAAFGIVALRNWIVLPAMETYTRKDFPNARPISEIAKDASLYLISSTGWPRAFPPTIIPLGALHVRPAQPIPMVK